MPKLASNPEPYNKVIVKHVDTIKEVVEILNSTPEIFVQISYESDNFLVFINSTGKLAARFSKSFRYRAEMKIPGNEIKEKDVANILEGVSAMK